MLWEDDNGLERWEEVMDRMREEISRMDPDWTDHNLHDPGIMMLELFAWMRQAQMYHASRIGVRHMRKYAGILGIKPQRRSPGHTLVTVAAPEPEGRFLEAGTRFYADRICFESRESQMVAEGIFLGFETVSGGNSHVLEGSWLARGKGISLRPFGERPAAGDSFCIRLARPLKPAAPYRMFLGRGHHYPVTRRPVEEQAYDGHGFYPLARIRMEYRTVSGWQEICVTRDETWGMLQDGSICFSLPEPMSGEAPQIRFVLERSDYLLPPRIDRISLAMVEAWQQETFEDFASWRGTGLPDQRYELEDGRIERESLSLLVEDDRISGKMTEWIQVEDFDRSGPEDGHYMLEDGAVLFGDGFRGRLPEGIITIAHMVRTLGSDGNIKAGTVTRLGADPAVPVENEWDVAGGCGEETPRDTLERFKNEGFQRQRAVTREDYETFVREIPGLLIEDCKAYAGRPEQRELILAVKPYTEDGFGSLNGAYIKNLCRYLEEKRLIGTRLRFVSPDYFSLEVTCAVAAKIQYRDAGEIVEREVAAWIGKKKFGEGIRYGELKGLIDTLPCVRKVEFLRLDTGGRGRRNSQGDILLPPNGFFRLNRVACSLMGS